MFLEILTPYADLAGQSITTHQRVRRARGRGKRVRETERDPENNSARKPRKERLPNWTQPEISTLINAKREKFFEDLDNAHSPLLMQREGTQWNSISSRVMQILGERSICNRDGPSCKDKWGILIADYKRIYDFHKGTGINEEKYWSMSVPERIEENLPRHFLKENYDAIDDWYHIRPIINPPHVRDLSQPGDNVYSRATINPTSERECYNVPEFDSSDSGHFIHPQPECPPSGPGGPSNFYRPPQIPRPPASPTPVQRPPPESANGPTLPPPTITQILSSSEETTYQHLSRKYGNTGQKRKSASGHTKIAEATLDSNDKLVTTLEKLNERDSKLQWDIFQQQLLYNRQKDMLVQGNARLAHINQSMVQTITGLTQVLSIGLRPNQEGVGIATQLATTTSSPYVAEQEGPSGYHKSPSTN